MSFNLGFLTDLVTMGQDVKQLVKGLEGDGTGFMSKAFKSFMTETNPESGLEIPGRARGALENWPKITPSGVSVGYQGIQTGRALRGLDYFTKINNANVLLAKDNWGAVYNSINTGNRLPRLGDDSEIEESKTAASPTITLES